MNKSLRKRHLQIWSMLLILLPITIFFAILAIPPQATSTLLQPNPISALPVVAATVDKLHYTVNVRTSYDSSQLQLEWINKTQLTTPTAVIFKISSALTGPANRRELIGRIESTGTYYFALNKDSGSVKPAFVLFDFIHNKTIDTINF